MSIATDLKNALAYLAKGQWREFFFRLQVYTGRIDLGIDRGDTTPTERSHPYSDSGGTRLEKVLDALKVTSQDAIVDFGAGKGGALITFSRYPFCRITGVELSPALAAIAGENLRKLGIDNVRVEVGDAAEFRDLDGYTYFYFFNPFPGKVMRAVIANIEASLARSPRKAIIIYLNPECHREVVANSSFTKIREFTHHPLGYFVYRNVA